MAVIDQIITKNYALYNGDCIEVMQSLQEASVDLSVYSPPFAGLYQYSSDEKDMSNCIDYKEFLRHYAYCIDEIARITKPGRMTAVHCMDVPTGNTGNDQLRDFPGDIIRLHKKRGFQYVARYHVWKEPLTIRNRTMMKSLSHKALCHDSTKCSMANADYLLIFRNAGENQIPVIHPVGLTSYAGSTPMPTDILHYRGDENESTDWQNYDRETQLKNKFSHWIWQKYASAFWDDVRLDEVLSYKEGKDFEDEKHVHPLQLDVIERAVILWSNPGEVVLTPFMGVGSEVYGAVINGRKGVGIELKPSYYRQAVRNVEQASAEAKQEEMALFDTDAL